MAVKKASDLKDTINSELADNNAGAISALDIRHNLVDIVDSIVPIIASGDFQTYPFDNNPVNFNDYPVAKSGIKFDTPQTAGDSEANKIQTIPFRGVGNIDHNALDNLSTGDPHPQYPISSGTRRFSGNFGLGTRGVFESSPTVGNNKGWINESGNSMTVIDSTKFTNNHGLAFEMTNPVGTEYS